MSLQTETEPPGPAAIATAGVASGVVAVAFILSLAAFLFSGELVPHLPLASTLLLIGTAIANFVGSRRSTLTGSVYLAQDTGVAILALVFSGTMGEVAAHARAGTAFALIAIASVVTGLTMLVLGGRNAGELVRFVPVPVLGGFLGGTGWILVAGAVDMATNGMRTGPIAITNVLAALAIAFALTAAVRRGAGVRVLPGIILGAVVLAFVWMLAAGWSMTEAREMGVFPRAEGPVGFPAVPDLAVDWAVIGAALPRVIVIPVVATLALLMNVGGLELLARRDADLDHELQTMGATNVGLALLGTPPAYHSLGISAIGYRLGIHSPVIPTIVAGILIVAAVTGSALVSAMPVALAAGLLAFIGLGFLADWLIEARPRMPALEYGLMLVIIVVIATLGFLPGVLLGLTAAVVLFTMKYSRLDPVRHSFTGRNRTSSIERPPSERRLLEETADRVHIVELQGFLFFGSAHNAVKVLEAELRTGDVDTLVVDMRRVHGHDTTAVYSFTRLSQVAADSHVTVVFSQCDPALKEALIRAGASPDGVFLPDLDRALEWCESRRLAARSDESTRFVSESLWQRLLPHMDRIPLETDQILADLGDDSDCVFVVETGRLAVELPVDGGRWQRVRSVASGNVVGEFALYLGGGRSARLRAECDTVVYRLSPSAIQALEQTDPACAIAFHRAVAGVMAARLTATNDLVRALIG